MIRSMYSNSNPVPASPKTLLLLFPGPLVAPRNDSDIVREGHPKRFLCCGKGFVRISWSFQTNGSHTWTDVTPLAGKIQVCNDGQVLQILAVAVKEEGLYRCTLSNGTAARSAYHRLRVVGAFRFRLFPAGLILLSRQERDVARW